MTKSVRNILLEKNDHFDLVVAGVAGGYWCKVIGGEYWCKHNVMLWCNACMRGPVDGASNEARLNQVFAFLQMCRCLFDGIVSRLEAL